MSDEPEYFDSEGRRLGRCGTDQCVGTGHWSRHPKKESCREWEPDPYPALKDEDLRPMTVEQRAQFDANRG
jgi:hypothetical protein